jgi:hypothetical protein
MTTPKPEPFDTDAMLREAAEVLEELIVSLHNGMHGDGEHSAIVADICRVTTAAATVAGELRARQKMVAKERDSLKPAAVMEWARRQSPSVRLHIMRELSASMDGDESVLA